jgi:hypothetical protein
MLSGLVSAAVTMPSVDRGTSSAELLQEQYAAEHCAQDSAFGQIYKILMLLNKQRQMAVTEMHACMHAQA